MNFGYGRGYYGEGQLTPKPKRRSWFTIVAVIGIGAAITWYFWPRKKVLPALGPGSSTPDPSLPLMLPIQAVAVPSATAASPFTVALSPAPAPAPVPVHAVALGAPQATGAFLTQLESDAKSRGFSSVQAFEDAVVTSAKQLQATGAQVILAPHLQHLAPRLST